MPSVKRTSEPATTRTDLLLLGLLLDRPMHGYELYQQIQSEGIDGWFSVSAAGVYYSLRKLRDQGWVVESRQRRGGSSRKSICRLTEEGRSVFFTTMEEELASEEETYLDYDLAIYLLNRLPRGRVVPQVEKHQTFLDQQFEEVQACLDAERGNGRSSLKLAILEHKRRFLAMERDWLGDVIRSIEEEGGTGFGREAGGRGLMLLRGNLQDHHLPDLFRLIVSGRHNGTLTVTDGADARTLSFEEGQPICAAYLRWGQPIQPLVSCDEVVDTFCDLFRWQEGQFTFDQKVERPEWCVPVDCSAEELILRGCRKVEDWEIIQRLVPSADTIFEPTPERRRATELSLTPVEARILAAVDGVKDVAAIAREQDLTLFETCRAVYCLTAVGVLSTADLDKIRLRRVFREMAELICSSTIAWRASPDDRECEEDVNAQCAHLPLRLDHGRIQDETDPQLGIDELKEMYTSFLQVQFQVVSRRFGRTNARQSFERSLRQLAPELQDVAKRYGFDRLAK